MLQKFYGWNQVNVLAEEAARNSRGRLHFNLHDSFKDPCQRLLNVINKNSYIRPHKHLGLHSDETIICIRGEFTVFTFDDCGVIQSSSSLSADGKDNFGVSIPSDTWHTLIALQNSSVIFECKSGPFIESSAKTFSDWSPGEGSCDAIKYVSNLYEYAL